LVVVIAIVCAAIAVTRWMAPAGSAVVVPDFIGMQLTDGLDAANAAGVRLHVVEHRLDYHAGKGEIVGQQPASGEQVREGRIVDIVVSDGAPSISVPNVSNMTVRDATVAIENAHLALGDVSTQYNDGVPEGTVLNQSPEPFTKVATGTKVDLSVARGRPVVYAPNFVGMGIDEAVSAAKASHIALAPSIELPLAPSAPPRGVVVAQDPASGEQLRTNQTIQLQVSGGPIPTPQPSSTPFAPPSEASSAEASAAPSPSPTQTSLLPSPTAPRGMRVSVALPQSPTPVRIRVVLLDASGEKTLYDQQTRGGFTLSFDLTVTGAGTLETYVGDTLVNSTPL
jgi:eukaryotic-like serine/threonine-protein kinase